MPILLTQAQQKYVFYLTAFSLKIFIHPQNTFKTQRAVCPIIHPAPPLFSLLLSAAVSTKMLDIASKVCSVFCGLTHIRLSPHFLAPRSSHQIKVFNSTRLPQEAHKKIYHMLKTWKLIQSQRSILSQCKSCCRSISNFTIYKTTPSFFLA